MDTNEKELKTEKFETKESKANESQIKEISNEESPKKESLSLNTKIFRIIAGVLIIIDAIVIYSADDDIFKWPNVISGSIFLILGIALMYGKGSSFLAIATFISLLSSIIFVAFDLRVAEESILVDFILIVTLIIVFIRIKDFGYESVKELLNNLKST